MSNQAQNQNHGGQQAPVLEMVLYRLQAGVSDKAIIQLSDEIQGWLKEQPGYLRRELFMAENGQWLDIVHWASMAEAVAASELIFLQPFAAKFGNIFAPDAVALHLYQVRDYEAVVPV